MLKKQFFFILLTMCLFDKCLVAKPINLPKMKAKGSAIRKIIEAEVIPIFKEFKEKFGFDLVESIGAKLKDDIKVKSKEIGNFYSDLSAEEITVFFAPTHLMHMMNESWRGAIAADMGEQAVVNQSQSDMVKDGIIRMFTEYGYVLSASLMQLYSDFLVKEDYEAALAVFKIVLENFKSVVSKMISFAQGTPKDKKNSINDKK